MADISDQQHLSTPGSDVKEMKMFMNSTSNSVFLLLIIMMTNYRKMKGCEVTSLLMSLPIHGEVFYLN